MKYFSFTTAFTDFFLTIENHTVCSLDEEYNISKIQFINSFKQNPKRIWYDKIQL